MNKIQELAKRGLITPPKFVPENVMYETYMGSEAYGVSGMSSDRDIYGFCIPPKDLLFPHLVGHVYGFGKPPVLFDQYQEHHIFDTSALGGKGATYDITIYNIAKYFSLCMDCNPNMIDSLFTPARCVITRTQVWQMVHSQREVFLCKKVWPKFKGYAYSQLHKMRPKYEEIEIDGEWTTQQVMPTGKRKELVEQYGYDVKFAYHLVRLMCEVEQILTEGTLDLERNREQLKAIRRGEWSLEQIESWFMKKESSLESVYNQSALPHSPREDRIKELLFNCLEHHYGDLSAVVVIPGRERNALLKIQAIVNEAL